MSLSLESCTASDVINDLGEELDITHGALEISWKARLHPLAYEKVRGTQNFYESDGSKWIKAFDNYRIPFVIHMRLEALDDSLVTDYSKLWKVVAYHSNLPEAARPQGCFGGLGTWRCRDEQEHPRPPKPTWNDFVWELATRYAEPCDFDAPQTMNADDYSSMPIDFLYDFYKERWQRFDDRILDVRERLMLTLLELAQEGKLQIEASEYPDGNYRILRPLRLPNRAWTEW